MATRKYKSSGIHIDRNERGGFYGQVVAPNGNILLSTSEDYTDKRNVLKAVNAALKELAKAARGFELPEELKITQENCQDHTK
jgi:uncharacterized protein YegP (UPF0339 family)